MGIEPTSSAWKADILADVLYPQLQKELYHNFPQMSSMNLGVTPSGANAPAPSRGRLMAMPQSLPPPRKAVPLGKVDCRAAARRKGYKKSTAHSLCSAFLSGGDYRDRTGDLLHAMQALSRTTHSRTPTQRCEDERYSALIRFISTKV